MNKLRAAETENENGRCKVPPTAIFLVPIKHFELLLIKFGVQKSQLRVSEVDFQSENQSGRCKKAPKVDFPSSDQAFWARFYQICRDVGQQNV